MLQTMVLDPIVIKSRGGDNSHWFSFPTADLQPLAYWEPPGAAFGGAVVGREYKKDALC